MPRYLWTAAFHEDAEGRSEVRTELERIARSDARGIRTIQNKIELLRQQTLEDALRGRLIKKPSRDLYMLKVQSGPVAYRLPFFQSPCNAALIILTGVQHRRDLTGEDYAALVDRAERLRLDWISRNCADG